MKKKDAIIKVGVGAVVFREDDALIIKRGKEPFKGKWSIPGGSLEFGETVEAAVRREVREETSVDIRILGLINVYEALPGADEGFDGHMIMIDYVADWVSGEPVAGDDASEAIFLPYEEARARISWDVTRRALDDARTVRNEKIRKGAAKSL